MLKYEKLEIRSFFRIRLAKFQGDPFMAKSPLLEPRFSPFQNILSKWDPYGKTETSKRDASELSTEFFFFISDHTLGISVPKTEAELLLRTIRMNFAGVPPTSLDFQKGGECHRPSTIPWYLDVQVASHKASSCLTSMVASHAQILIISMQLILHSWGPTCADHTSRPWSFSQA